MQYYELYESVCDYQFDNLMAVTEGANIQMRKDFKKLRKEIKGTIASIKSELGSGDRDKANKEIDRGIKLINKMKRDVLETDLGVLGTFCGWWLEYWMTTIKSFALGLVTFGIASWIIGIKRTIEQIDGIIKYYKHHNTVSIEMLNTQKNEIVSQLDQLKRQLEQLKKRVNEDDNDDFEESVIKLEIYESMRSGEITEEEMHFLLEELS